jgi:hypothetical protein
MCAGAPIERCDVVACCLYFQKKLNTFFQDGIECSEPATNMMNTQEQQRRFFTEFSNTLANGKITPEQACSLIEKVRDAKMFPDEIDTEDKQQKGFYEIAWLFADWKITTEDACELFKEWIDGWKPVKN